MLAAISAGLAGAARGQANINDPLSVANDNGEGTAWVLEIPKPIGWKGATVSLLVSGSLAAFFTLSLLFVFVG